VLDKFVSSIKNDIVDMQDEIAIMKANMASTSQEINALSDTITTLDDQRVASNEQLNAQPVIYEMATPKKSFLRSLLRVRDKNSGNH
jgi:cell division protein FtsB